MKFLIGVFNQTLSIHDKLDHCDCNFIFVLKNFSEQIERAILALDNIEWKVQYYLVYGRCFTFQLPEWMKKLKVFFIIVETKMDAYIFLHYPGNHAQWKTQDSIFF